MKNIIFILVILFNVSCMSAQEVILKKGKKIDKVEKGTYYRTDDSLLNKYTGIWFCEVNSQTFKFEILKRKTEVRSVFFDRIVAKYYFDDNSDIYSNETVYECSAKEYGIDVLEKGVLRFRFWDYNYQKYGELQFELIDDGSAKWTLFETGGYRNNDFIQGFSVPTEMILTKEN